MRDRPLVLILDDEDAFLEIASVRLNASGFDTHVVSSVEEALEKAEALLPDLILSDIFMPPGRSGWDFALALRENPKTRGIKTAFFTTLRDPWLDVPRGRRGELAAELGDLIFFDKTDDVGLLPERLLRVVTGNA